MATPSVAPMLNQTGEAIFPAMLRTEIHPVMALRVVQAHARVLAIKVL